jgi:glycerol-3-phosphate acyltransferase PlsY
MPVDDSLLHGWFYGNLYVRLVAAIGFSFLFGAIRFRPTAAWLFAAADPRLIRSFTGVAPVLDAIKGYVPTIIALHGGGPVVGLSAAVAVVAGDCASPLFPRFRAGNRGVAAAFGALCALNPFVGTIFGTLWVVGAASSNYAAIGSLLAAAVAFLPLWVFFGAPGAFAGVAIGLIVASRYGDAFVRLRDGREPEMRRLVVRQPSVIRLGGQAVERF